MNPSSYNLSLLITGTSASAAVLRGSHVEAFRECVGRPTGITVNQFATMLPGWREQAHVRLAVSSGACYYDLIATDAAGRAASAPGARALAECCEHGLDGAVQAALGSVADAAPLDAGTESVGVLAVASASALESLRQTVGGLATDGAPALFLHARALSRMLGEGEEVVVLELGQTRGWLVRISAEGIQAVTPVAVTFASVLAAVHAELKLHVRGAAEWLFFNEGYDFSAAAAPIARRCLVELRRGIRLLGGFPSGFAVAGLPSMQSWLSDAIAAELGLTTLTFSPDHVQQQWQITFPATMQGSRLSLTALSTIVGGVEGVSLGGWQTEPVAPVVASDDAFLWARPGSASPFVTVADRLPQRAVG